MPLTLLSLFTLLSHSSAVVLPFPLCSDRSSRRRSLVCLSLFFLSSLFFLTRQLLYFRFSFYYGCSLVCTAYFAFRSSFFSFLVCPKITVIFMRFTTYSPTKSEPHFSSFLIRFLVPNNWFLTSVGGRSLCSLRRAKDYVQHVESIREKGGV